jgi:hypothetical protein
MSLYDRVADLPLQIEEYRLDLHESDTSSGFTRATIVVELVGDGEHGYGEDVTYDNDDQYALIEDTEPFPITDAFTLSEFSETIDELDLFPEREPGQDIFHNYRQWAFESAALDLALKQDGTNLADTLDREYDPVRFVVSTRLGDPATTDRVEQWLDINPELEFKLDPTSDWTASLVDDLAKTDAITDLDLKGQYHGTSVDQPVDPELYELVVSGFPDALIEDPALTDETRSIFDGHEARVTWDYPITGVKSIRDLPWEPEWLNIKPSRFGSVESLFDSIDYCIDNGIRMFGGGQFELDVGREHIHAIASLFYPDAANDVAPSEYNDPEPQEGLPTSPLQPPTDARGLDWSPP